LNTVGRTLQAVSGSGPNDRAVELAWEIAEDVQQTDAWASLMTKASAEKRTPVWQGSGRLDL
jgi:hypothetical protein